MNFIGSMDKDNDGWTPFIFACRYGHQDAVQLYETFLVILNHCGSWSNDRKRVLPMQFGNSKSQEGTLVDDDDVI